MHDIFPPSFRVIEIPPVPIKPPLWFTDNGFADLVERLLVTAALLDMHVGCLMWLGANAESVGPESIKHVYRQQCLEDAEAITDLSVAMSNFACKVLEREKEMQQDRNIVNATAVLTDAVGWIEQLRELLGPADTQD